MKKTMSTLVSLILLVWACNLMFQGCGKEDQNVIKIGVIGPLSGEGATYGMAMKRGIDLAIEERNAAGGLLGKKIIAVYEDDKYDH